MEKVKNVFEKIKKGLKNKYVLIALAVVVLIIIGLIVYLCSTKENHVKMNNLKIEYLDGPNVKIDNVNKGYTLTKRITVENTTDDNITYSLSWKDVKNTFKEQNKLLYEIKGTGDYAASLGKSQVPVVGFKVFNSVVIQAKKKQEYEIIISYTGDATKEKDSTFEGKLNIYSKEVDKKALEKQEKEQEKALEAEMKKQEEKMKKEAESKTTKKENKKA